jgi:dihydroorotate dehydrogenase (NAD+) catalytic subunit
MYKTDIHVNIGSLTLKNPVMPASGAYGYYEDNANVFTMDKLGAIVVKSVHREKREGNPGPRIVEVEAGMINSVGIPSGGIEKFIDSELDALAKLNTPVIISISGGCPEDFIESAKMLDGIDKVGAIEINLSCPNVGSGLQFASDEVLLGRVVQGVRSVTKHPIISKLSPNVTDIRKTASISEDCGADAVTIANTFISMKIDIDKQKPVLGNIMGGLSGPAIKPINMRMVYQVWEAVKIPIIACGGITCWQDAIEYILAGASAVQVGCANFVNPLTMVEVVEGIDNYLHEKGCRSIDEIRGAAHL